MKYNRSIFNFQFLILLTLVLVSCGPDKKHFAIDGQLLNLNQGEFVIYSPDGAMEAVDTITLAGGRFNYEGKCPREGTAIIILPNGQDIPVFISPGNTFTIKGNAQSLKDMTVKGGKDNDIMNAFRKDIASASTKDALSSKVKDIVKKNPGSIVCNYLIRHYLIDSTTPDYKTASALLADVMKARPNDATIKVLNKQVSELKAAASGCRLPFFSATDINDKSINSAMASKGIWLICSFATWDYETLNKLRRIKSIKTERSAEWNILGVSLDPSKVQCKNSISYEAKDYTVVCDEKMTESPLLSALAMHRFPYMVVVKDGTIIKRGVPEEDFMKYLKDELK